MNALVTPLWILSGVLTIGAAVALLANQKNVALGIFYAAIILGLGSFFAYVKGKIDEHEQSPQVSVVAEVWMRGERTVRGGALLLLHHYYGDKPPVISPITDLIYVRLTNKSATQSLMIDYFAVEVSNDGRKWVKATLVESVGKMYFSTPRIENNIPMFGELIPQQPLLRDVVFEKNINPTDTVKGWMRVERPEGFDNARWRMRVKNLQHDEVDVPIEHPLPARDATDRESFSGAYFKVGERRDLTGIQTCFFSECGKLYQ